MRTIHIKGRPAKEVFPKSVQRMVLKEVRKYVKGNLPKTKIYMARIFGSLAKGTFGRYKKKLSKRGKKRRFSDVDVLFVVSDNYKAPRKWPIHFNPPDNPGCVYRPKILKIRTSEGLVYTHVEYIVMPIGYYRKKGTISRFEKMGMPLRRRGSKNKFLKL